MSSLRFAADDRPTYDQAAVQPMRDELTRVGIQELLTPDDVARALDAPGTALLVINSVCGCAAGNARPGAMIALQNRVIPDRICTVFAGQEKAAVAAARGLMVPIPPSSPCIAVFKDGKVVHVLQRHDIEGRNARMVADSLVAAFDAHCSRPGPSIPAEEFEKIVPYSGCGSSIPMSR